MLGFKIKLYSSKYFIQNNHEVKNNLLHVFLQESPAKDGFLPFKIIKLSYGDTGYLPLLMHSCFPASAPCDFCLISYSVLLGCFNKTFCLVKYTVLRRRLTRRLTFSFLGLCYKKQHLKANSFLRQITPKILIYTVETRLCYSCF